MDGPQNTNIHFVPKTENQDLVFYFHFTEAQCQILLSYVTIARLCNKKMKNIIRFLWREIVNEPTGIYEQGIILAEV